MSKMDLLATVQRTELGGVPPNPIGVAWWNNDDVLNCCVLLTGNEYGPQV